MQQTQFEAIVETLGAMGVLGTQPAAELAMVLITADPNTDTERDEAVQAAFKYATNISATSAMRNMMIPGGVSQEVKDEALKFLGFATALTLAGAVAEATVVAAPVATTPARENPILGLDEEEPGPFDRYESGVDYDALLGSLGFQIVDETDTDAGDDHCITYFTLFNPKSSEYGLLGLRSASCQMCDRLSQCENPGAVYALRDALATEIEWFFGPNTAQSAIALKIAGNDDDEENEALTRVIRSIRLHKEQRDEIPF